VRFVGTMLAQAYFEKIISYLCAMYKLLILREYRRRDFPIFRKATIEINFSSTWVCVK